MTTPLQGIAPLTHLGVIQASGPEAAAFLQGQLTQDVLALGTAEARLAAFCNPKGRMQASFIGLRQGDDILLVLSRDLLPQTLKRLSMFVLRAKAKLSDASAAYAVHGAAGDTAARLTAGATAPWSVSVQGEGRWVRLYPADGVPRALGILPAGAPPPEGAALSAAQWQWGEVRSGVATLTAPVFEAFVPQMLNYESVGGVNFKKGCYPGQEVVARSQFRGTLKRRAFPAHAAVPLAAGQELFHSDDPTQPCGLVAQAAPSPAGGWDAIVSIQLAAAAGGTLTVGQADGPVLALQPLPYPLLADV